MGLSEEAKSCITRISARKRRGKREREKCEAILEGKGEFRELLYSSHLPSFAIMVRSDSGIGRSTGTSRIVEGSEDKS